MDYHAEREAQLVRAESVAHGYATETAEYFGSSGRAVETPLTFKSYLEQRSGLDYPYPAARRERAA